MIDHFCCNCGKRIYPNIFSTMDKYGREMARMYCEDCMDEMVEEFDERMKSGEWDIEESEVFESKKG